MLSLNLKVFTVHWQHSLVLLILNPILQPSFTYIKMYQDIGMALVTNQFNFMAERCTLKTYRTVDETIIEQIN